MFGAGISGGGVLAAWIAQTRSDITRAVAIAPTFSYRQVPSRFVTQFVNLADTMPNLFIWWNPKLKENNPGPQYGYPRFSTRAAASILRLGLATHKLARQQVPGAKSIIITTNPNDLIVDDALVNTLVENWRAHGAHVKVYPFSADLNIGHDIIDPKQPDQQTATIYPKLVELIAGE